MYDSLYGTPKNSFLYLKNILFLVGNGILKRRLMLVMVPKENISKTYERGLLGGFIFTLENGLAFRNISSYVWLVFLTRTLPRNSLS